jgi:hypothetical protein
MGGSFGLSAEHKDFLHQVTFTLPGELSLYRGKLNTPSALVPDLG